jgi:hypothetical protein
VGDEAAAGLKTKLVILAALLAGAVSCGRTGKGRTVEVDSMVLGKKTYRLEELFRDSFDGDMSNWSNRNPKTKWEVRDGKLWGKWGDGGSVVWLKPVFEGDVLIVCRVETLKPGEADWRDFGPKHRAKLPEGGKNLNLFMLCSGPKGENMLECYERLNATGSGPNGMGEDKYKGYFFTWTLGWARFRYLPGYECVHEWSGEGYSAPEVGKVHEIVALRRGKAIRYFIDGRLVHDHADENPHSRGQMGFCLWRNLARIHEFRVCRITDVTD